MVENPKFITSIDEITLDWLNDALRGSKALQSGRVIHFQVERSLDAPMSNDVYILSVEYEHGSQGSLPPGVFFKRGRMYGEVDFQKSVAQYLHPSLLVPCYYAAFANELGQSNLLFADLHPTHRFPEKDSELGLLECMNLMPVLATLHRELWEHPEFKADGEIGAQDKNLPLNMALPAARNNYPQFVSKLGDRLPQDRRDQYERIFASLPHPLWQARRAGLKQVTIVHGDVHVKNLAFPRSAGHPIHLADWSLWHIDLPTYDLAYLLALRMPKEKRNQIEMNCLKEYHLRLGISAYSFEQLLEDYRLSILFHTIWPPFFQSFSTPESWLPLFDNIMQAFDDWNCTSLL